MSTEKVEAIKAEFRCLKPGCACAKVTGNTHCPVHDDKNPSLSVTDSGGKLSVNCFAGCSWEEVVTELDRRGLWSTQSSNDSKHPEQVYLIPLLDGRIAEHHRVDKPSGKDMWWAVDGKNGLKQHGLTTSALPLYGAEYLADLSDGDQVVLTEGEKAAKSLRDMGIPAVGTVTGASGTPCDEVLLPLVRLLVTEWPDNDDVGQGHMERIASRLESLGRSNISVVNWSDAPPHGDAADAVSKGADVRSLLKAAQPMNLTSDYREGPSEVRLRAVKASVLRERGLSTDKPVLEYLQVLGVDGFIIRGWSHLLSAYPKAGKTELITRVMAEWCAQGLRVTYYTEEPQSVWEARLATLPGGEGLENVEIIPALGFNAAEIQADMQTIGADVVVVDTVRLLRLEDENSNSEINRTLTPLIAVARNRSQTLLFLHHNRKGAGDYGVAASGGHAFLGIVDIGLELVRVSDQPQRRILRGWGRIHEVPELIYELADDGLMKALGNPHDLELTEVVERVRDVLMYDYQSTNQIREAMGDPKPSKDQVSKALTTLATHLEVERDPPITSGPQQGKTYQWRLTNLTSDDPSFRAEVRLEQYEENDIGNT